MGGWVAGLAENKANSANPAELELGLSWTELGKSCNVEPLGMELGLIDLLTTTK